MNPGTSRRQPNFLIAGAGESGTSWLTASLLQHPEVYLPKELIPEPQFFYKSKEYEKGFEYYLDRYFAQVPDNAIAVGERSSSYIFGEDCPQRIAKHLPHAKIIVMLRNPVERAYSNWRFTVQSGWDGESFDKAVRIEEERLRKETNPFWREVKPYANKARGLYGPQVERMLAFFPKEQLLILNSDIVRKGEAAALVKICNFLGVDPAFKFASPGTFPTSSVRCRKIQRLLRKIHGRKFDYAVEKCRMMGEEGQFTLDPLAWILKFNLTPHHPKLKESTRRYLESHFEDSNRQLAQYVDWDPLNWA